MKIFISYKRNLEPDQSLAEFLEQAFCEQGYSVFRDATGIQSGTEWGPVIERHLEESDVVVSLVSNDSMRSTWVLNEIDRALQRRKLLIPVVLEKLDESLEFQVFRPRFMQLQHYPYNGRPGEAAQDLCERLRQSPAVYQAQWYAFALDAEDDSENSTWSDFFKARPQLHADGKYRLALDDAVRLAIVRSAYYQRCLHDPPPDPRGAQAFLAFRHGYYTLIVVGDFGLTGFARTESLTGPRSGEIGGYLGLLLSRQRVCCLQDVILALDRKQRVLNARFEVGMIGVVPVQEHRQIMSAKETELHRAIDEFEDNVDHFKTYRLGIPSDVALELEDPLLRALQFIDPTLQQTKERIEKFDQQLAETLSQLTEKQIADLKPEITKVQNTVAVLFPQVGRELEQLSPKIAGAPLSGSVAMNPEARSFGEGLKRNLADLQRNLYEPADRGMSHLPYDAQLADLEREVQSPYDAEEARRRVEDRVREPIRAALDTLEQLGVLQAQIRLAAWEAPAPPLSLEQAMTLALAQRPDRQVLETNITLRRDVRLTLRRIVRDLDRGWKRLEHARRSVGIALDLLYVADLMIAVGKEASDHASLPLATYHESHFRLVEAWLHYHADRMRLFRETGLMQIDPAGLWVGGEQQRD